MRAIFPATSRFRSRSIASGISLAVLKGDPDLPGCVATGRTRADVQRRIREAIGLHLEALRRRGEHAPETSAAVEVIEV